VNRKIGFRVGYFALAGLISIGASSSESAVKKTAKSTKSVVTKRATAYSAERSQSRKAKLAQAHASATAREMAETHDPAKKSYEKIDGSTMAKRVEHVMQCAFNGRRVVVFSGGEAKDLDGVYEEIRGLRDGGANGSIIGRNTFQRPKEAALEMLNKIIDIYLGKA
jgi:DhnA family fructose-bisphosphate aldolase class Ia